jgi:hypothetical protein
MKVMVEGTPAVCLPTWLSCILYFHFQQKIDSWNWVPPAGQGEDAHDAQLVTDDDINMSSDFD